MRLLAMLDRLPDDRDSGRAQQLAKLGEIVSLLQRGDAVRALPGATLIGIAGSRVLADTALTGSLHVRQSSPVRGRADASSGPR